MRPRLQMRFAATIALAGLAGVAAMIRWEDEPGALPLGVLLAGAAWWVVAWQRLRADARRAQ